MSSQSTRVMVLMGELSSRQVDAIVGVVNGKEEDPLLENLPRSLKEATEEFQRRYIRRVLELAGKKTVAARMLGMSRAGLHMRMRKLGM